MPEPYHVHIRTRPDSQSYQLWYRCPLTNKKIARSANTSSRREAERAAARWEAELAQHGPAAQDPSWDVLVDRYRREHLPGKSQRTRHSYTTAFNQFERHIGHPARISGITSSVVSQFASKLRTAGLAETSIANTLRHIKAVLRWAQAMGLSRDVPRFVMPSMAGRRLMKGRAITEDEFERLLAAARKHEAAGEKSTDRSTEKTTEATTAHQPWSNLLRALWLSGLRLQEALLLSWSRPPMRLCLDATPHPYIEISARGQKARRDEILPLTPDFTAFARALPRTAEHYVFGGLPSRRSDNIGREISIIGKASGIVVIDGVDGDDRVGDDDSRTKYVSAHDLRRSFGSRWAKRLRPVSLRQLMRHRSIETTLRYYVEDSASDLARELWECGGAGESPP